MHEDKRLSSRRKKIRRMYDMLHGKATEEEKQQFDRLLYSRHRDDDRRAQSRRSGTDRRDDAEGTERLGKD